MRNKEYMLSPAYQQIPRKKKTSHRSSIELLLVTAICFTVLNMVPRKDIYDFFNQKYLLKEEDFKNARWSPYKNPTGEIYSLFLKQKISHNLINKSAYEYEVNKRNPQGLTGNILVPSLDGNKLAGNQTCPSPETLRNFFPDTNKEVGK